MGRSLCWSLGILLIALVGTDALAKKKGKALTPVAATVANQCEADFVVNLGGVDIEVKAGATSEAVTIPGVQGDAYPYVFKGSTAEPRYVFIGSGAPYALTFSNCIGTDGADLAVKSTAVRPEGVSPNAAAQIRFRATSTKGQALPNLQYKAGNEGRFRPLAVSFTSYKESVAGNFGYGLKLMSKRMRFQGRLMPGRQLQMRNGNVTLEAGKKYLIEVGVVANKITVKFEEEGWIK